MLAAEKKKNNFNSFIPQDISIYFFLLLLKKPEDYFLFY